MSTPLLPNIPFQYTTFAPGQYLTIYCPGVTDFVVVRWIGTAGISGFVSISTNLSAGSIVGPFPPLTNITVSAVSGAPSYDVSVAGTGGTATPVVNNLTTGGATSALSAAQGVVLANANPDPFVGMTSDQIRAAPANGIAYFGTYNSVNAAAAHVVAKDQSFSWTPAAANAAWVAAGNAAPVTPMLTGKIWYDSIGKIILVSAWA